MYSLTTDARIVAIRWDLLEWGVVFDLDTPVSESEGAAMRRAWLAFSGVAEVTLALQNARLPTGIWLKSSLESMLDDEGFRRYTCQALLPVFEGHSLRSEGMSSTLSIRAQDVVGVVSRNSEAPREYGLSFESRQRLCADLEMLKFVAGG